MRESVIGLTGEIVLYLHDPRRSQPPARSRQPLQGQVRPPAEGEVEGTLTDYENVIYTLAFRQHIVIQ